MTLSQDIETANARNFYLDIAWMGLAFALEWYFLNVFAIRMGATPAHLGAMASVRALMLVVGSSLSSWWQHRFNNLIVALRMPMLLYRVVLYLGVASAPFLPEDLRVNILVGAVVLSAVPAGVTQGCFLGMMRIALSEQRLATVVAWRTVLMNITVLLSVVGFGQLLEHLAFPGNYQISFVVAFAASLISWWAVLRIKIPDKPALDTSEAKPAPVNVWKHPGFLRFALTVVAIDMGVFMAAPLVQLHLVRNLNASDTWISVFGMSEMVAGALIMIRMNRLIERFGTAKLIAAMAFATFVQAFVLGLTPTLPPFIIGELAFGMGWFALNALLFNRLVEIAPTEGFPQYAATYVLIINASLFVGPLISTFLVEHGMSLPAILLMVAGLRFGAGVLAGTVGSRLTTASANPQRATGHVQPSTKKLS